MNLSAYVGRIQCSLDKNSNGSYEVRGYETVEVKMVFTDREQAIAVYERFVEEVRKHGNEMSDTREGNLEEGSTDRWIAGSEDEAFHSYVVSLQRSLLTYDRSTSTLVEAYEVYVCAPIIEV